MKHIFDPFVIFKLAYDLNYSFQINSKWIKAFFNILFFSFFHNYVMLTVASKRLVFPSISTKHSFHIPLSLIRFFSENEFKVTEKNWMYLKFRIWTNLAFEWKKSTCHYCFWIESHLSFATIRFHSNEWNAFVLGHCNMVLYF